jgi:putative restriction endonuclease
MVLSRSELESHIIDALRSGSQSPTVLSESGSKPLRVATSSSERGAEELLNIYAWNVTHGGATRSPDEFRIQITGNSPEEFLGEQTLILGWSQDFEVFAAWDPTAHVNRHAGSQSLQIHREVLTLADQRGIAAETRGSGDAAIAFRPEYLSAYARVAGSMHLEDPASIALEINEIPENSGDPHRPRSKTARVVEAYFREWDFAQRVLSAYSYACAVCGIQLGLIEAAHILPVAAFGSTDQTSNGISLCRIHHRAYDSCLINIAPDLTIRVSEAKLKRLRREGRSAGEEQLLELDGRGLLIVPSPPDNPNPTYLAEGAVARNWEA